jgi:membrane-associated PAP2 superfamily phosphatase
MKHFARVEAVSILAGAVFLNHHLQGNWVTFLVLAVVPELALLGYIQRDKTAWWPSLVYNVVHVYTLPIVLVLVLLAVQPWFLLGWVANIALNRAIGFGFKSPKKPEPAAAAVKEG